MASAHDNQTRPKFTWRFLAVEAANPDMRPITLYTNAPTEEEARENCAGWVLYFAARFPLHVPEIQGVSRFQDTPRNRGDISKGVRHA